MTTQTAPDPGTRALRIWVVEDSAEDFAALARAVSRPAPTAELRRWERAEALLEHVAEAAQEKPDLMIVDLNLPGIDGAELIGRLRECDDEELRTVPVCVLSSSTRPSDIERCRAAGADDYAVKPARAAALRELAERTLQLARQPEA